MSTRSAIARKTGNGFSGVYHHWDGYPSGLGATLFALRNGHFEGHTSAMLHYLIDEHPQGWSTINGSDFSLPAGSRKYGEGPCEKCGCPQWMHYQQYYQAHDLPTPPSYDGKTAAVFNHSYSEKETPHGPECFGKGESGKVTQANASGCGCEWAYVFDADTMLVQSSFCNPNGKFAGQKMIGAFGCGDEKAYWETVARVDLNGPEPDWEAMDKLETVQN